MCLRKKTSKLESVLLAHQRLGKNTDSTSLDIYIYFHATNWLRYFILCKHWQEININKVIPMSSSSSLLWPFLMQLPVLAIEQLLVFLTSKYQLLFCEESHKRGGSDSGKLYTMMI